MKRIKAQSIGEILRDFFEDNTEVYEKIIEIRIQKIWQKLLGPMAMQYTRTIYVHDRILYIHMSSAVLRSELLLCKDKLKINLNKEIGYGFLFDIVIR